MGFFDKIKEPVFLKDSTKDEKIILELEDLAKQAPKEIKEQIESEINKIKFGLLGEQRIEFELKNSHIPMFVIHDLYLECDGLTAQIDYLVLTKRRNFVIECKNLYGNLTISSTGDFIRYLNKNGGTFRERIYSPVTQNRRHLELIKLLRGNEKNNFLTKAIFEKYFYDNYRSIVVFANHKGLLNTKYAPKDVKEQVVNVDQLVNHIKKINNERGAEDSFEKDLLDLAQYFIEQDKENPTNYIEKYRKLLETSTPENKLPAQVDCISNISIEDTLDSLQHKTNETKESDHSTSPNSNIPLENVSVEQNSVSKTIICSRCGAPMIERIAKKGDNKGKKFLGCSSYPKCRYILNIED